MRRVVVAIALMVGAACGSTSAPSPAPTHALAPPPSASSARPLAVGTEFVGEWDVRWDRAFAGWSPAIFEGRLSIQSEGGTLVASLRFSQSNAQFTFVSAKVEDDRVECHFATGAGPVLADVAVWASLHDDRLLGEMSWGKEIAWTPFAGRRHITPKLVDRTASRSLPSFDIAKSGVDRRALDELVRIATDEHSSALLVLVDGKIGLEKYREDDEQSPILAMSGSKSVAALAVGMLIAEGKLSLDTRVSALLPEWKSQGDKAKITIRHLLSHTSGLDPSRADFKNGETIRAHASAAKLYAPPGSRFQYNNGAVDLSRRRVQGGRRRSSSTHTSRHVSSLRSMWLARVG